MCDAVILVRVSQAVLTLFFTLTLSALHKAVSLQAAADASIANAAGTASKNIENASSSMALTRHQQTLLGLSGIGRKKGLFGKPGMELASELKGINDVRQRPPRVQGSPIQPANSPSHALMVPLHPAQSKGNRGSAGAGAAESGFLWGGNRSPSVMSGPATSISPSGSMAIPRSYPSQV